VIVRIAKSATSGLSAATTEIDEREWDAFVHAHADATPYHLWRWRSVFEDVFGHRCEYLALRDDDRVVGVLPLVVLKSVLFGRFGVSLPFVNYGGVLATSPSAADALLAGASTLAVRHGLTHLELRHREPHYPQLRAKQHKVAMVLPLAASTEEMWAALDRKVRNQIRKAEKSGLTVETGGLELLADFYTVFARNMRDLGTPVYSRRFFLAVLSHFGEHSRVFVVRCDGEPIGAAVSLTFRDVIEVPWASSLREHLALCPNNLLYWAVIQYAIGDRLRALDFGRSTPNEGTFHFKRQWGAGPAPLHWEYYLRSGTTLPDHSPKNPRFRGAIEVWKWLPVGVANRLGPSIVRGIP